MYKEYVVRVVRVFNGHVTGEPWYHEKAESAQQAVDNVRRFIDDYEEVVGVFKEVKNWK